METATNTQDYLLSDLYDTAYNAYRNTSFSPERRAQSVVKDYSEELASDLSNLPAESQEDYTTRYRAKLTAWLSAKSRCVSSMITGRSNFNVRRAEKANNSEHNRLTEFIEFRENYFKRIEKAKERAKTPDQKRLDFFNSYKKQFMDSARTIHEIDAGINRYTSRPLIVSNMYNKIKTIVRKGDAQLNELVLDLLNDLDARDGLIKPIFTKKHKVWQLLETAPVNEEAPENKVLLFDGGTVTLNYTEDRIQVTHDSIPSYDTRQLLKKNGFRWSPFNKAWQRKINEGAKFATVQITGVNFNQ